MARLFCGRRRSSGPRFGSLVRIFGEMRHHEQLCDIREHVRPTVSCTKSASQPLAVEYDRPCAYVNHVGRVLFWSISIRSRKAMASCRYSHRPDTPRGDRIPHLPLRLPRDAHLKRSDRRIPEFTVRTAFGQRYLLIQTTPSSPFTAKRGPVGNHGERAITQSNMD